MYVLFMVKFYTHIIVWMFACNKKCHQKIIRAHLLYVTGRLVLGSNFRYYSPAVSLFNFDLAVKNTSHCHFF